MPEDKFFYPGFDMGLQMNFRRPFYHNNKNTIKISFIICLISLTLAEFIAYLNPQKGYEISFYSSTPSLIFVLIGVAIVGGIYILVQQVLSGGYRNSKIWIGGFLLLLLTRMIILYLPYIRGYLTWMGDNSTHLGLIKEALVKGHVDSNNFYPITHIFSAQISLVTSLSAEFVANHATVLFSVLFVLSVYLLARMVFEDDKPVILTIAAVGCVIFSGYELYIMPNGWSCLFLPLAIYFTLRSMDSKQNFSYKVLALIAIVLFPFFHPLSTLLLTIILLLFIFVTSSYKHRNAIFRLVPFRRSLLKPESSVRSDTMPLFLMGMCVTIWTLWILSFRVFDINIRNLVNSILTSETADVVGAMAETADKMDFNLMDILILAVKDYGDELIFIATFFIGAYIFIKNRENYKNPGNLFLISILPITFGLIYLVYLSGSAAALGSVNAVRVLSYIVLVAPIFSGIFFSHALSKKRLSVTYLCILLLVIPPALTLFSVFPSPYLHRPTPDIAEMDVSGMEWSIHYKDLDLPYAYIMSPPDRFADIILGRAEREKRSDIENLMKIPDHFRYGRNMYLGESYTNNSYAVITKFDTVLYDTAYERVGRFHSVDFARLQADRTVDRIYCNDECTVYSIHPVG